MDTPPITPTTVEKDTPNPKKKETKPTKSEIIEDCLWLTGC